MLEERRGERGKKEGSWSGQRKGEIEHEEGGDVGDFHQREK